MSSFTPIPGVHPDLLNSRFAYVSISRASHEATLFTDDAAKLDPQLGADVSKTSALEIYQASSVAQGIGIVLATSNVGDVSAVVGILGFRVPARLKRWDAGTHKWQVSQQGSSESWQRQRTRQEAVLEPRSTL